jgi:hypothetical protein
MVETLPVLKSSYRYLAVLVLLAWIGAWVHVAGSHAGDLTVCADACLHQEESGSGSAPEGDGHHHHDLGALLGHKPVTAPTVALLALPWTPLVEELGTRWVALAADAEARLASPGFDSSPPDERFSGWLLIVHTARPVRGPSLFA